MCTATAGNWTTRGYANSRTGHLADWSTHGLDNSRTSQLAVSQMPPKERKLSTQSRRWHPRVVQSVTCPVRELSSPRVDQSARCPVRESSSPRGGNARVGVSTSCPVTLLHCESKRLCQIYFCNNFVGSVQIFVIISLLLLWMICAQHHLSLHIPLLSCRLTVLSWIHLSPVWQCNFAFATILSVFLCRWPSLFRNYSRLASSPKRKPLEVIETGLYI